MRFKEKSTCEISIALKWFEELDHDYEEVRLEKTTITDTCFFYTVLYRFPKMEDED